jgi:hypothetical protein
MPSHFSSHVQPERRAHLRYPVKLAVRYQIKSGKAHTISGRGTSVNISSTGMLFRSAKRLEGGDRVLAAVDWPPKADGKPMTLLFHGHVVWMKGSQVAITVSHYGFLPDNASETDDLEHLETLAAPRYLTPTRFMSYTRSSVRQWKQR